MRLHLYCSVVPLDGAEPSVADDQPLEWDLVHRLRELLRRVAPEHLGEDLDPSLGGRPREDLQRLLPVRRQAVDLAHPGVRQLQQRDQSCKK